MVDHESCHQHLNLIPLSRQGYKMYQNAKNEKESYDDDILNIN